MQTILALVFLALAAPLAWAQSADGAETALPERLILPGDVADLNDFVWTNRPLVVFADSPNDPRFVQQMAFIREGLDELAERDVVVLTDTDPAADSALRERLHPRGFMLVLIGKDGTIYLRKPLPRDVREISRVIDKMPMRQQEIEDRRGDS